MMKSGIKAIMATTIEWVGPYVNRIPSKNHRLCPHQAIWRDDQNRNVKFGTKRF
jgi:hypothetical protein